MLPTHTITHAHKHINN